MILFRGRGTAAAAILSAIVVVALIGGLHLGLVFGFRRNVLPEAQVPFILVLILSFGFIATFRLAGAVRFVRARRRRWVGVDERGFEWTDGERVVHVAWEEVEEVRVHFVRIEAHVLSYVTVQTLAGERVALSHLFQGRIQEQSDGRKIDTAVVDVEMTPFLLWMVSERAGLSEVEPLVWRRGAPAEVVVEEPGTDVELAGRVGVSAKTFFTPVQVALVIGSLLLYKLLLSERYGGWLGAGLFVALLLCHELGHVWAMVRLGMKVRGVYFIPLLGAATVPETLWRDRDALAYTSLSGPLWGVLASAPILAAWYLTGREHGVLLGVVLLNAALNLLNLLPIPPLDGARVLASIASSVSPRLGLAVGIGVVLLTLSAAVFTGEPLLWALAALGVVLGGFEVLSQYSAAVEAEKVRSLVPAGRAWTTEVARLGDALSLQTLEEYAWTKTGGAPRRVGRWTRWQQVLGCEAMRGGRIAFYLCFYLLLVVGLVVGLAASIPLAQELWRS
ncbi:MAG: hypothetical protein AAB434_12010 [Planctomycetota bacterium]|mgnify:CR=1 FL=1